MVGMNARPPNDTAAMILQHTGQENGVNEDEKMALLKETMIPY